MQSGTDLEQIILTNLQRNEEYTRKVIPFLKPEYFEDKTNREYFKFIDEYFATYSNLPSANSTKVCLQNLKVNEDEFKNLVNTAISIFEGDVEPDINWLSDSTEEFCKSRSLYLALMQAVSIIDTDEKDSDLNSSTALSKTAIPDILSEALGVSFDTQIGHDYLTDTEERFTRYKEKKHKIPFHIDILNSITGGGIEKKTINCILSPTGGGKTMLMCDLAANYMKAGQNVLYITMEMAEENIALRVDANLMNVEIGKIKEMDEEKWERKVADVKKRCAGRLKIKEYPTGSAHVGHFRFLLKELKQKQKFTPDIIIIDYLNICSSAKHKDKSNSYGYIKSISEELRGFATESNVAMITATQTNRSGQNNTEIDITNVSESMGGPMTMDLFFALIPTEELAALGQVMIKQLKNRYEDVYKDNTFMIGVDRAKMKFYDVTTGTYMSNPATVPSPSPSSRNNSQGKSGGNFSGITT